MILLSELNWYQTRLLTESSENKQGFDIVVQNYNEVSKVRRHGLY